MGEWQLVLKFYAMCVSRCAYVCANVFVLIVLLEEMLAFRPQSLFCSLTLSITV